MVAVAALEKSLSAEEAVALREHVMRSMRRWRAKDPEDLAQEVLVRILSKLRHGLLIMNPLAFAHKVAVHVLREERRSPLAEVPLCLDIVRPEATEADQELLRCVDVCWQQSLSRADRALLRRYDAADATSRQALPAKQGLTLNALRINVYHLRSKLRACVLAHLDEGLRPYDEPAGQAGPQFWASRQAT